MRHQHPPWVFGYLAVGYAPGDISEAFEHYVVAHGDFAS